MTTTIPRTSAMLSFTASFISLSRCEPGAVHRPDLGATLTHEAPRRVEPQVLRRPRRRTGGGYRALLIRVSKRPASHAARPVRWRALRLAWPVLSRSTDVRPLRRP